MGNLLSHTIGQSNLVYLYDSWVPSLTSRVLTPFAFQQLTAIPFFESYPNMPKATSRERKSHGHLNGDAPSFDTTVPKAPVTYKRVQAINSDDKLDKPGVARANAAVSSDKPNGEPEQVAKYKDYVGRTPTPRNPRSGYRDTDRCASIDCPPAARIVLGQR